jgi:hypothetical protein
VSTRCIGGSVLDDGKSGAGDGIMLWNPSMGGRGWRRWEEMRHVRGGGGRYLVVARRKDWERVRRLKSQVNILGCICSPWKRRMGSKSMIRVPAEKNRVLDAGAEVMVVTVGDE